MNTLAPKQFFDAAFASTSNTASPFANLIPAKNPFSDSIKHTSGSQRRKLWDLPAKYHCPVIGVCFDVDELRALMAKVMSFPAGTTDYALHSSAVAACEFRSDLSRLLHKTLEKRYHQIVRRFAEAKTSEQLAAQWKAAIKAGTEISGALWASWSHPACDLVVEQEIYRDIHMIQHQIGSGARADLTALKTMKNENSMLREQLNKARKDTEVQRNERQQEKQALNQTIIALQSKLIGQEALGTRLNGELEALQKGLPELKRHQKFVRRTHDASEKKLTLNARIRELEAEVAKMQELLQHADATIKRLLDTPDTQDKAPSPGSSTAPLANLNGKCILCVGGRSGSVDAYRQIVELRGGRFLHHDGGLEENLHRIDAALSAADLVICQAGCISHNAYWRVKEQCKRTGKQCVFVKGSGTSSFDRIVNEVNESASTAL